MPHFVLSCSPIVLLLVQLVLAEDRPIDMAAVGRPQSGPQAAVDAEVVQRSVNQTANRTDTDDTDSDERSRVGALSMIRHGTRKRITLEQLRKVRESIGVVICMMSVMRSVYLFFAGQMQVQLVSRLMMARMEGNRV